MKAPCMFEGNTDNGRVQVDLNFEKRADGPRLQPMEHAQLEDNRIFNGWQTIRQTSG